MQNTGYIIALLLAANVLLVIVLIRLFTQKQVDYTAQLKEWLDLRFEAQSTALDQKLSAMRLDLNNQNIGAIRAMSENLQSSVNGMSTNVQTSVRNMGEMLAKTQDRQSAQIEARLKTLEASNEQKLDNMRAAISSNMEAMRNDNTKKLDQIRHTVEEQLQDTLQKRIGESFQSVTMQLEQVYKGLGEMQNLASDVGGLKRVLSGVKTRGILGEIQLGAILREILAPEQYATNVSTIPGSKNAVEFAIRLPGGGDEPVWLPIDSKFPGDTYARLQEAYASGEREQIDRARKDLARVICSEAKDIRTKYVEPPYTTNFAVLFLPFEGLYAEVVNLELLEKLQQDYQVSVAGPSTMSALLTSLQMGFKTLAIQKRSNEVWTILGAVKSEFDKFGDALKKMQRKIRQTDEEFDELIGKRTRAIQRKLRDVQTLDAVEAQKLLPMGADDAFDSTEEG